MEIDDEKYNLICEQLKQCLLPEFDRDIGSEPLIKEDFSMSRYGLEMILQLLFDIVVKNDRLLREPFEEDNTFRTNLILLVHQQSGDDDAPFQTDSRSILKQIRHLTEKYYEKLISVPEIRGECCKYYKERLKSENWKLNIGAVYGFVQMNKSDDCLFMLSVGMLLCDYFETIYKEFGLTIFNILLEYGLMTPLIVTMKEETTIVLVMSCLVKCIESFSKWHDPSTWNEIDDVLEAIFKRIPFETDNRSAVIHFMFVASVTTVSMKNRPRIFRDQIDFEHLDGFLASVEKKTEVKQKLFTELRNIFGSHHNLHVARWSKKLIEIFKQRTIVDKPDEIRYILHISHVLYLVCFYGNPLFLRRQWSEFLNGLVTTMLNLVTTTSDRHIFIDEIDELLETLKLHLENAPRNTPDNDDDKQDEIVTSFMKSLHEIKNELAKYRTQSVNQAQKSSE